MATSDTPATVHGTAYTFGIDTDQIEITGVVAESATLRSSVQIDEEGTNNLGLVAAYAIGGLQFEVTVSGKVLGDPPEVGTNFDIDGNTMFITGVETSWGERDWKKVSITAKGYEGISG
jgi:hypothetical protein